MPEGSDEVRHVPGRKCNWENEGEFHAEAQRSQRGASDTIRIILRALCASACNIPSPPQCDNFGAPRLPLDRAEWAVGENVGIRGDLTFEEWIDHVFDHADPGWHWDTEAPYWNPAADPPRTLEFLCRLFSSPAFLIDRFTPNQIGVGLNYLASPSLSDYAFAFLDPDLPIEERVRGIHAIATLYEELLSTICLPVIHHGNWDTDPRSTQADFVCYMFWDVFPLYARTKSRIDGVEDEIAAHRNDHLKIEAACLDAMERTLAIDHLACQEGALHGLGHWADGYPERVRGIIDAYLDSPRAKRELLGYAKDARKGRVQ